MTKCKGCGVELQYTEKNELGFSPKEGAEYCKRCFRLAHYGDIQISMKTGIDSDAILEKVNKMDALVLWVVDIFDFEASILNALNRQLFDKDIVVVATKVDLLPPTLGEQKIAKFVYSRLKEYEINVKEVLLTGLNFDTEMIFEAINEYYKGRDIVVIGMANVGKSTFINNLMKSSKLTSSRYPGTTLDFNELQINDYKFIDTPGLRNDSSLIMHVKEEDLKKILSMKRIKPTVFQLRGDQSFAVGGLLRLDFVGCEKISVVFYMSNELDIHRGKYENADDYWNMHYEEFQPKLDLKFEEFKKESYNDLMKKFDIVINGLGWVSVSVVGNLDECNVYHHPETKIIIRKAMM
jgi:hypothetical protein